MSLTKIGSLRQRQENNFSSRVYVADTIPFSATPLFKNRDFLHQKYCIERLSTRQIAALCASSRSTIAKYLKQTGVASELTHATRKGQVAFGRRLVKNDLEIKKSEKETIREMLRLRSQGYSLRQIAAWLDAKGIRTKNNRGRWQAATVMKILRVNSLQDEHC